MSSRPLNVDVSAQTAKNGPVRVPNVHPGPGPVQIPRLIRSMPSRESVQARSSHIHTTESLGIPTEVFPFFHFYFEFDSQSRRPWC